MLGFPLLYFGAHEGQEKRQLIHHGRLYELEKAFYGVLEEVQTLRLDLIPATVDVKEDYRILRSLR